MRFFREILTVLALLLVIALSAALVAPYFVDWKQYRAQIEERLSFLAGARVVIDGDIEVRLLPSPRLSLGQVSISRLSPDLDASEPTRAQGAPATAPPVRARGLVFEIAPLALLRGDVRFTEMRIDRPHLTIALDDAGRTALAINPGLAPEHIAFENILISNATVRFVSAHESRQMQFDDVSLELSALSLAGPWRGAGTMSVAGQRIAYHFNSGLIEEGRMRLKVAIEPNEEIPRVEFDGAILAESSGDGRSAFRLEGQAKLLGHLSRFGVKAWQATGPLRADVEGVSMDPLDLRLGSDERHVAATGSLHYRFGQSLADLKLETPRVDADHLADGQGKPDGVMAALGDGVGALIAGLRELPPVRLSFNAPALTIGGETLADVAVSLTPQGARAARLALRSGLPGRATVALEGDVDSGADARFKGLVRLAVRDSERLAHWAGAAAPALAAQIRAFPFRSIEFFGDLDISAAGFFSRAAEIVADRSRFRGLINYTRAIGAEPARIALDLISPALDLDHLPDLSSFTATAATADFSIALDARAVRLARVGQGMIDAGRIVLRAQRTGDRLEVERINIANLGGATVSASGFLGESGGRFDLKLDAERLGELANLAQRIAPGPWSEALAQRAAALSPANLIFTAQMRRVKGALSLVDLSFEGAARGTEVNGRVTPAESGAQRLAIRLALAGAQTPLLLRQFGLDTVPLERMGASRVEIEASGAFDMGFDARVRAWLAGVDLVYEGKLGGAFGRPVADGRLQVSSADAAPLLQILALALPDATALAPVQMATPLRLSDGVLRLDGLKGVALGSRLTGSLSYGRSSGVAAPEGRKLTGELVLDELVLESLAALALGPRPPSRAKSIWPDFRFAAALADPLPTEVAVRAERLVLPGGLLGENARFKLELGPGLVAISDADMTLASGRLQGRTNIRRDGANASIGAQLTYNGPVAGGEAAGTARVDIEFAGTGTSYAAIVAGLGGRGRADLSQLRLEAADPAALARLVAASEDLAEVSEGRVAAALGREFARAPATFDTAGFDIAIAGGVLSFSQTAPGVSPRLNGSINLRALTLDAALTLVAARPEGWVGADAPEAAIRWTGPLQRPARTLAVASLVNGLSARAIEREAARIEMLEFEARERAMFNRRLRAREFMQQREAEVALWQSEQARRAAEEQRRAEEEARRREAEEQRAAARRAAAEAERERREKEKQGRTSAPPSGGAPIQLAPPAPAPALAAPAPKPLPLLNDPAAAGRY